MQFMKTLFWVILAIVLTLFSWANWTPATISLWGGLLVDVKLPLLALFFLLVGFVPTWIVYRARLWSLQRRLDLQTSAHVVSPPAPARPATAVANTPLDRQATDAKAWPAQ